MTAEQAAKGLEPKDVPDFFYVWDKDEPSIPGSTLRGMLRALIEIASFSKIATVTRAPLVYRAVGDTTAHGERYRRRVMHDQGNKYYVPLMHAGYMRRKGKDDWYIQPAQNINGTTFAVLTQPRQDRWFFTNLIKKLTPVPGCRNAYKLYVRVGSYDFRDVREGFLRIKKANVLEHSHIPGPGLSEAVLALSGPMFSKRSEAVVYPEDSKAAPLKLCDKHIERYRDQITKEQEKLLGPNGVLQNGQPVFYTIEQGQVEFFGHCRMLRLPYKQSPYDFVPENLRREEDLDFAEALFGFTKEKGRSKKAKTYAGRVRVGDARLMPGQSDLWLLSTRPLTPRILASPKPTTFQHYLVQTQPDKNRLKDYAAPTPDQTVIRGHKLYWHKGAVQLHDIELHDQVSDSQITKIRPLRAGVEFAFQVRFDNLSGAELGALLWVLRIAADERYRLTMGMGKPLGMGAIKITSALRLIDRTARYSTLFDDQGWHVGLQSEQETAQTAQDAVAQFERSVLAKIGRKELRHLTEENRIQQLLAMLSWPGPNPQQTRYLEIEHPNPHVRRGKENEYRDRPVLPSPLTVLGIQGSETADHTTTIVAPPVTAATVVGGGTAVRTTPPQDDQWQTGIVHVFGLGPHKSYGFISSDTDEQEVFIHRNVLPAGVSSLRIGQRIRYKTKTTGKRIEAIEVELI